jgi:phage host-nuclease inhibitor protein Gam
MSDGDDTLGTRPGCEIHTLASASWAMERMAEARVEVEEIDRMEREALDRVKARCARLRARASGESATWEARIVDWMQRARESILRGSSKSRSMVHGRVGWREQPERLVVEDADLLALWLREQPVGSPLVRVKVEPVMAEIQRHLKSTGEIPPGCRVEPGRDIPYVQVNTEIAALTRTKREE